MTGPRRKTKCLEPGRAAVVGVVKSQRRSRDEDSNVDNAGSSDEDVGPPLARLKEREKRLDSVRTPSPRKSTSALYTTPSPASRTVASLYSLSPSCRRPPTYPEQISRECGGPDGSGTRKYQRRNSRIPNDSQSSLLVVADPAVDGELLALQPPGPVPTMQQGEQSVPPRARRSLPTTCEITEQLLSTTPEQEAEGLVLSKTAQQELDDVNFSFKLVDAIFKPQLRPEIHLPCARTVSCRGAQDESLVIGEVISTAATSPSAKCNIPEAAGPTCTVTKLSPELETLDRLVATLDEEQREKWLRSLQVTAKVVHSKELTRKKNKKLKKAAELAEVEAKKAKVVAEKAEADRTAAEIAEKDKQAKAAELDAKIQKLFQEKQQLFNSGSPAARLRQCGPGTPSQQLSPVATQRCFHSLPSSSSCTGPSYQSAATVSEDGGFATWDIPRHIPPVETNEKAAPIGRYWDHLRQYALSRARKIFLWDVPWNRQNASLKIRFKLRLHEYYPGPWDDDYVMKYIGNNMKERRSRIVGKMKTVQNKDKLVCPIGCTPESWNAILESLDDPKRQSKSHKCRVAAEDRYKENGPTHRWGRMGMNGAVIKFEDEFGRPPSKDELEYAKVHSYTILAHRTRDLLSTAHMEQGMVTVIEGDCSKSKSRKRKPKSRQHKPQKLLVVPVTENGKQLKLHSDSEDSAADSESDTDAKTEDDGSASSSGSSDRDSSSEDEATRSKA